MTPPVRKPGAESSPGRSSAQGPPVESEAGGWRQAAARYRSDLILFFASLAIYALASDGLLAHQSLAPQFVYQADAFLQVWTPPFRVQEG